MPHVQHPMEDTISRHSDATGWSTFTFSFKKKKKKPTKCFHANNMCVIDSIIYAVFYGECPIMSALWWTIKLFEGNWKQLLAHDARRMNNSVHPVDVAAAAAKQYLYLMAVMPAKRFRENSLLQLLQSARIIRTRSVWWTSTLHKMMNR